MQQPTLASPLRDAVGAKTANALSEKLDLHTVGDLLHHYPRRYAERGEVSDLGALEIGEHVTVAAKIERISVRPMRQKPRSKMLEVTVTDGRRHLQLTFFNQAWRERELRTGRWGLFAGKVSDFRGKRQLVSPAYQLLAVDALAGRPTHQLSYGERKRVAIAGAVAMRPCVLLLDEPTAGLDLGGREDLLARLTELAEDPDAPAMVLVTHHVEEIPPGITHALLLRKGEVVAAGPVAEALTADTLSATFGLALRLNQENGRYAARAL